jgi:hypothetical protein
VVSRLAVDLTARAATRALGWGDGDTPGGGGIDRGPNDAAVWTLAGTAWGLIEGHTRGRGCPVDLLPVGDEPTEAEVEAIHRAATPRHDVLAVAVAVTLRLAVNPAQRTSESKGSDGDTHRVEGSFQGFTLTEQMVLNRYRRRHG